MPYAEGRVYYDADSHVMETSDWLVTYAAPDIRERIRPLYLGGAGALADDAVRDADARKAGTVTLETIEDGCSRARVGARTAPSIPRSAVMPSTCSGSTSSSCS